MLKNERERELINILKSENEDAKKFSKHSNLLKIL